MYAGVPIILIRRITSIGDTVVMRMVIVASVALLVLGCAHRPAPATVGPLPDFDHDPPGDEPVPVRTPADVVGHYRAAGGDEAITIYVDAASGALMMRSTYNRKPGPVMIRDNGGLAMDTSLHAGLVRRRGRVMLQVVWCYRQGVYWRDGPRALAPLIASSARSRG